MISTTASTQLFGVLGSPVSHSLSPAIHSVAIEKEGIDAVYLAFEVGPQALSAALDGLRAIGARGLSITAPHKERILPLLDGVSDLARRVGAVNTVFRGSRGELLGDNTDVGGLEAAISEAIVDISGRSTVVLGAGGAASAAVVALARGGARQVTVLARDEERGSRLVERLRCSKACPRAILKVGLLEEKPPCLEEAAVVVQATSAPILEGPGVDLSSCSRGTLALDMAYDGITSGPALAAYTGEEEESSERRRPPCDTAFIREARKADLETIDGVRVLIHQGVLAWRLWLGRPLGPESERAVFEISKSYREIMSRPTDSEA